MSDFFFCMWYEKALQYSELGEVARTLTGLGKMIIEKGWNRGENALHRSGYVMA